MNFYSVYQTLYKHYGPQHWWPGETPFEIMVGAVLTQNTAWSNVEKAIENLKTADSLSLDAINALSQDQLAEFIRPAGYFNVKAKRLHNLCRWLADQGGETTLSLLDDHALRRELLTVNGVGPETADDIVLYAFNRPVFVIDAYTRRIFSRLGLVEGDETYEALRHLFENRLADAVADREDRTGIFNEYHALIVIHAKDYCRKRPLCDSCCLEKRCPKNGID